MTCDQSWRSLERFIEDEIALAECEVIGNSYENEELSDEQRRTN